MTILTLKKTLLSLLLTSCFILSSCSSKSSANTYVAAENIPAINCTTELMPSVLELEIIEKINQLRTRPKSFIPLVKQEYASMRPDGVYKKGSFFIRTEEGKSAVNEAIKFLKRVKPVGSLDRVGCLSISAQDHVIEQGHKGGFGHAGFDGSDPNVRAQRYSSSPVYCGENIAYGSRDATAIVIQLLVDDGVPDRGHRINLFRPEFLSIGVANGYHSVYEIMSSHTLCLNPSI